MTEAVNYMIKLKTESLFYIIQLIPDGPEFNIAEEKLLNF